MLYLGKQLQIDVVYSDRYPSGLRFGQAIMRGIPNTIRMEGLSPRRDTIGFFTPDNSVFLKKIQDSSFNWYYGDHAYFKRGKYFRVTRNSYQHSGLGISNGKRLKDLDIKLRSWKKNGTFILLCPQSDIFFKFHGTSQKLWIEETVSKIREFTDRPIRINYKSAVAAEDSFERALEDIFAVVVHSSIAGVQATVHGIPCFTTEICSATQFGKYGVSEIENPAYIESRHEKLSVLADNQWRVDEMLSGKTWRDLCAT
jgi:hypothetical protein